MKLPNKRFESGIVSPLLLVFFASVLIFIAITFIFSFKKEPLPSFYPKPSSHATVTSTPAQKAAALSYELFGWIGPGINSVDKDYLFAGAAKTGKKLMRNTFDLDVLTINGDNGTAGDEALNSTMMTKMDDNINRAKNAGFEVVGVINRSVPDITDKSLPAQPQCTLPNGFKGPIKTTSYTTYDNLIKLIVQRYTAGAPGNIPGLNIDFWEVWNEPSTGFGYCGDTVSFAKLLKHVYDVIKGVNGVNLNAQVIFPGLIHSAFGSASYNPPTFTPDTNSWFHKVMNDSVNPGKNYMDVGNVHDYAGTFSILVDNITLARKYYNYFAKTGPMWVTENGYPSDWHVQVVPYKGTDEATGQTAQSEYYKKSLPAMLSVGATKVFVSLRDAAWTEGYNCDPGNPPDYTTVSIFCSDGFFKFPHYYPDQSGRDSNGKSSLTTFQNKVLNTGCEYDTFGWTSYQGTIASDTTQHHGNGGASCKATQNGGTQYGGSFTIDDSPASVINPVQNDAYTATVWVMAGTGSVGQTARLYLRTSGGASPSSSVSSVSVTLSTSWQQLTVSRTIDTADRTGLEVYVQRDTGANGNIFYADDFVLTRTGP